MNRNYQYDPNYAYKPTQVSNFPIEEELRAKFANRGIGAISVNAARTAQMQRSMPQPMMNLQQPRQMAQNRPVQQNRSPQNRSAQQNREPQNRPAQQNRGQQNRPVQPRGRQMQQSGLQQRQVRGMEVSRPSVFQKSPLYEVKTRRSPLPISAMVSLIVCTLTVLSVVMGTAMVGHASDEVSDLKNEAAQLSNIERELSQALDRKNDLRTIERIAVDELGMIGTDLITKKYISFSGIDVIEAYDDEETESVGLSTLLAAIGIGVK